MVIDEGYTFPREGAGWGFSFKKDKITELDI
jgi:hypothetical protein